MSEDKQLITIEQSQALHVFIDKVQMEDLLNQIKEKINSLVIDVESPAGRKEIASMAYSIARTKTYLDGIGKDLVAEYKELPKRIDAARKYARDLLDGLKDDVRKPLDEWEAKQKIIEIGVAIFNCWDEAHEMNTAFDTAKIAKAKQLEEELLAREAKIMAQAKAEAEAAHKADLERQAKLHEQQLLAKEQEAKAQIDKERNEAIRREEIAKMKAELEASKAKEDLERKQKLEEAAEQKRISDLTHRAQVQQSAVMSLVIVLGIDIASAENMVKAIDEGLIDSVFLKY